jgi:hypothetical protein
MATVRKHATLEQSAKSSVKDREMIFRCRRAFQHYLSQEQHEDCFATAGHKRSRVLFLNSPVQVDVSQQA